MPNNIRIIVQGPARSGKKWVKAVIADALRTHHIPVAVVESELKPDKFDKRVREARRDRLVKLAPNLGAVLIVDEQTAKGAAPVVVPEEAAMREDKMATYVIVTKTTAERIKK